MSPDTHNHGLGRMVWDDEIPDTTELLRRAVIQLAEQKRQIDAVLKIHKPYMPAGQNVIMTHCVSDGFTWPCVTARACGVKDGPIQP